MEIAWSNQPPPPQNRRVLVLKPGYGVMATMLDEYLGVYIHWAAKRSRPCNGRECTECRKHNPRLWKAYIPCSIRWFIRTGRDCNGRAIGDWSVKTEEWVLELSESHTDFLSGGQLRGLQTEVWKPAGDPKQSLRLINAGFDENPPPSFEVKPVLYKLWALPEDIPAIHVMEEEA